MEPTILKCKVSLFFFPLFFLIIACSGPPSDKQIEDQIRAYIDKAPFVFLDQRSLMAPNRKAAENYFGSEMQIENILLRQKKFDSKRGIGFVEVVFTGYPKKNPSWGSYYYVKKVDFKEYDDGWTISADRKYFYFENILPANK